MDAISDMAVFAKAVEAGGFSSAARMLGLTPSAVSKLVTRLEDRLDARLFNRTTRRLSLTQEGEAYYQRAVRILADIEEAEAAISKSHGRPKGRLRLTIATAAGPHLLGPLLPEFFRLYPEVQIDMLLMDRVADMVEEGLDLAIRIGSLPDQSTIARKLMETRRVICAAPAYLERAGRPQRPDDLARHNCLRISGVTGMNEWPFDDGKGGTRMVPVAGNLIASTGEMVYEMGVQGIGIIRLSEFVVAGAIRRGALVRLFDAEHRPEPLPVYAVYPARKHLSPKVTAFVDFLARKLGSAAER